MQQRLGSLTRHQEALAMSGSVLNVERKVDGCKRRNEVWNHTGQTDVHGLVRHGFQAESLLDGVLFVLKISTWLPVMGIETHKVTSDTSHHIHIIVARPVRRLHFAGNVSC